MDVQLLERCVRAFAAAVADARSAGLIMYNPAAVSAIPRPSVAQLAAAGVPASSWLAYVSTSSPVPARLVPTPAHVTIWPALKLWLQPDCANANTTLMPAISDRLVRVQVSAALSCMPCQPRVGLRTATA